MGIPQEIRAVARPTNTVVLPPGKDGSYPVRERIGCKRHNGQNQPVSGCIIGHIIGNVFIWDDPNIVDARRKKIEKRQNIGKTEVGDQSSAPEEEDNENQGSSSKEKDNENQGSSSEEKDNKNQDSNLNAFSGTWEGHSNNIEQVQKARCCCEQGIQILDWGIIVYTYSFIRPLISELVKFYAVEDAKLISAIAVLRVCYPGVKDYQLQKKYDRSVLKFLIPNINIGKNNVSDFQAALGERYKQIVSFMANRTKNIKEYEPILIDGTLKSDESDVNHLSAPSRKAKDKGTKDISLLVVLSSEQHDPICSMCFSGNIPDASAFPRILEEYNITRGMLIGDKGFPAGSIKEWTAAHPELHFLLPIRRNSKYIEKYHLREYKNKLNNIDTVLYSKAYDKQDKVWIYSFHDATIAGREHKSYVHNFEKRSGNFLDELSNFGDIDIISDIDMTPEKAYEYYQGRWEIEVSMRYYKMALNFDETRVNTDYTVIGSEFINFLANVINYRMIQEFIRLDIRKDTKTYKEAKDTLVNAQIALVFDDEPWILKRITERERSTLEKLGLIKGNEAVPMGNVPRITISRKNTI